MSINQDRNRQREQAIVVADLVDHYIETELSDEADWHSHATRIVYGEFLKRWVRPYWGLVGIRDVRTVAVERWLKELHRVNGERLADATKAKIRNLMSVLFNHAIRYEWLEQGRNPITLVRQSAQRKWTPEILEPHEIQNLLKQLSSCFQMCIRDRNWCHCRKDQVIWGLYSRVATRHNTSKVLYGKLTASCAS